MKRAAFAGLSVIALGVAAMAFVSGGLDIPVLDPAGPIARAEMRVIFVTLALSSIIIIPVFFLLFFFAWKYRDTSPEAHVHHHPTWDHDSPWAEFLWWLVPTTIIAMLAVVAWQSSHAIDPYVPIKGEGELTVQVVALNWKWLFIYPEQGIASRNELAIPAHTPVRLLLTADAPMNSFWIPSLAGQIMVMPGMQTQLHLAADREGEFRGSSGNLSGEGFSGMTFTVRSMSKRAFNEWILAVKATGQPLDDASYAELRKPSDHDPVNFYAPVADDLYGSIYMSYLPEGSHHSI